MGKGKKIQNPKYYWIKITFRTNNIHTIIEHALRIFVLCNIYKVFSIFTLFIVNLTVLKL